MKKTHIIFGMLLALGVACAPEEEAQGGNNFGQRASFVEKKDNKAVSFYTPISLNLSTDDIGQEKEIGYQIQLLKEICIYIYIYI